MELAIKGEEKKHLAELGTLYREIRLGRLYITRPLKQGYTVVIYVFQGVYRSWTHIVYPWPEKIQEVLG